MDTRRLHFVNDICPLAGHPPTSIDATHWKAAASPSTEPIIMHEDGYTSTILNNRFITWHRTFTNTPTPPPVVPPRGVIHVREWVPRIYPGRIEGWRQAGPTEVQGVYFFADATDYQTRWSSHAKRHLKQFKKSGATLALGTIDDAARVFAHSQVPPSLQTVFLKQSRRHLDAHPQDIDFLTAWFDGQPVAVFIALNCDEAKQSYYLSGGFDTRYPNLQALTGIINWWYARSLERGYIACNFGGMAPPKQPPLIGVGGEGYSIFKTHFGIRRVWSPASFWKFTFGRA